MPLSLLRFRVVNTVSWNATVNGYRPVEFERLGTLTSADAHVDRGQMFRSAIYEGVMSCGEIRKAVADYNGDHTLESIDVIWVPALVSNVMFWCYDHNFDTIGHGIEEVLNNVSKWLTK